MLLPFFFFFFFNDTATTEIYTLSLHDALPILLRRNPSPGASSTASRRTVSPIPRMIMVLLMAAAPADRKSTRLNSSHSQISYAVFCLKKTTVGRTTRVDPRRLPLRRPRDTRPQ